MILVDTGAIYALIDRNDKNHQSAKHYYETIAGNAVLCISLPILTEACLLIEARLGLYFVHKFWESVLNGIFEVLAIDKNVLNLAFDVEKKYKNSDFGFVDSTCFAICEKYKIIQIFTYDRKHFSKYKPAFTKSLSLLP